MKLNTAFCCLCFIFASIYSLAAQGVTEPELRRELLSRLSADQAARSAVPNELEKITPAHIAQLQAVDKDNTKWLKTIIGQHGFPTRKMVCADGVYAAFMLVQHADRDLNFQKSVLPLLERSVRRKDAPGFYYAYLTDRTLTAEKKPQRYGSQLKVAENNRLVPYPIEDELNLEKRRAALGLPSMAEYLKGKTTLQMPKCESLK